MSNEQNRTEDKRALQQRFEKYLIKVIPAYLVYFLIAPIILIQWFGTIKYGPNLPYLVSLALIGLPFSICLIHLLGKADAFRTEFIAGGGDKKAATPLIASSITVPLILLFLATNLIVILQR